MAVVLMTVEVVGGVSGSALEGRGQREGALLSRGAGVSFDVRRAQPLVGACTQPRRKRRRCGLLVRCGWFPLAALGRRRLWRQCGLGGWWC